MGSPLMQEIPSEHDLACTSARVALTASDRCDACTAAALVRAHQGPGKQLLLCGHHFNAHEASLLAGGWVIDDQRAQRIHH